MKKKQLRIGIFLPKTTPFYISLYFYLKRAFEQHDCIVSGSTNLLSGETLSEFCRQFKPDFIFEMNRTRDEIPELPGQVKHIAWIVDYMDHRDYARLDGSDILYYMLSEFKGRYSSYPGILDWLPPGACPETYYYEQHLSICDISFIGHIPKPWSKNELERIVYSNYEGIDTEKLIDFPIYSHGKVKLTFKDVFDFSKKGYLKYKQHTGNKNMPMHVNALIQAVAGCFPELEKSLKYDLFCRSVRLLDRSEFIRNFLAITKEIKIYGPDNWSKWSEFEPYYDSFISDPNKIRKVYQSSKINLHEGAESHFRIFDCLGSGGVLLYQDKSKYPHGSIFSLFEPNKHFIHVRDESELKDIVAYYLKNDKVREKMSLAASKEIANTHTWYHRAKKIIYDYKSL